MHCLETSILFLVPFIISNQVYDKIRRYMYIFEKLTGEIKIFNFSKGSGITNVGSFYLANMDNICMCITLHLTREKSVVLPKKKKKKKIQSQTCTILIAKSC